MRVGLIAALRRSENDAALRAVPPLAGRSVLGWQAALLQSLGIERVLCLVESQEPEVLALQHALEGGGVQFHALRGFAALPALVRAEDDLIVLADGLVPDPEVVHAIFAGKGGLIRTVATFPADHPLAVAHPQDFERIDAARHWAGVLTMRGAPVQQLAEFPADADAIGLLLRLALQAGTPQCDLAPPALAPDHWLLATDGVAAAQHESALIARAAPAIDPRAPGKALAAAAVRALVPRGLQRGAQLAGGLALALSLFGLLGSAAGYAAAGLWLAAFGAFAAEMAQGFGRMTAHLRREPAGPGASTALAASTDLLAGGAVWFALAPLPVWQPLAVAGPVVLGLARLVSRTGGTPLVAAAGDRTALLLLLALSATIGLLPETLACLALGLVAALLLRGPRD